RPTLLSPLPDAFVQSSRNDAFHLDESDVVLVESQPPTVPSASLPQIPPPPRAPSASSALGDAIVGAALVASAALPLVALDHRATVEALQAPAALTSICALEREVGRLRRRTTWLTAACVVSIALSVVV